MRRRGLLFLLLACSLCLNAELIQIGNGTLANQSLPIESFRYYSYSQQLYRADQINTAGLISSIAFQYSVASPNFLANNADWKVYLGQSFRNCLENWISSDSLSLVYDGALDIEDFSGGLPGQGWLTISLANPFFFNGAENLLVAVDENSPLGGNSADEFLCSPDSEVRGIVFTSYDVNPDPLEPPSLPAPGFFFARNAYPNLRLEITPFSLPPWHPQPENQAAGVPVSANLQWQSNASAFDLLLGTDPQELQTVAQGLTDTQWTPSQPFQMMSTYYWQIIAYEAEETYPGEVWSFNTAGEGIGPPHNLSAYYITDHVQLYWEAPLQGYPELYRLIRNGVFLAVTESREYQDFEVAPGQIHYYNVLTQNHLGEISGPSNTATVHIPSLIPYLILYQGFEDCEPFSQTVPGWQNTDLDGSTAWDWDGIYVPGLGENLAWLVFNPHQTEPPQTGINCHGGVKMLASMACYPPPNNDWLISPRLQLGSNPALTFWARSHTADYGLERLRVLISGTGVEPGDFVAVNTGNWLLIPAQWTEYCYVLSAWQGQSVYLAFNCVSWDAQALYIDDVQIVGEGGYVPLNEDLALAPGFSVYPNPSGGAFSVANPGKAVFNFVLYDLRGRKLFSANELREFNSAEHPLILPAGIYLLRLDSGGHSQVKRLAIIK